MHLPVGFFDFMSTLCLFEEHVIFVDPAESVLRICFFKVFTFNFNGQAL